MDEVWHQLWRWNIEVLNNAVVLKGEEHKTRNTQTHVFQFSEVKALLETIKEN